MSVKSKMGHIAVVDIVSAKHNKKDYEASNAPWSLITYL